MWEVCVCEEESSARMNDAFLKAVNFQFSIPFSTLFSLLFPHLLSVLYLHCACLMRISVFLLLAACKDHRKALEVSQHSEEMGLILGVCAGGLVVLILLLGAVIIIIKKG